MIGLYVLDTNYAPVLVCSDATDHAGLMQWAEWFASADATNRRRVDITFMPDGREIATVFLGVDQRTDQGANSRAPLVFETVAYTRDGSARTMARTASWHDAAAVHAAIVHQLWAEMHQQTED